MQYDDSGNPAEPGSYVKKGDAVALKVHREGAEVHGAEVHGERAEVYGKGAEVHREGALGGLWRCKRW